MKYKTRILTTLCLLSLLAAPAVWADVQAKILTVENPQQPTNCLIRWLPVDKVYVVTIKQGAASIERKLAPDQVLKLQVAPPAGWKDLARANTAAQIPALKKVANDYKMLQYDGEAGARIGQIYLEAGNATTALKEMRAIVQANKETAVNSPMAPVLWRAMIEANQASALPAMLDRAALGDRKYAGLAMNARGDLLLQEGRTKDALKDGYLRTAILFADQPSANAEGLYKAAKVFDKLGQSSYANKMKKLLQDRHPGSAWAKKLVAGE